MNATSLNNLWTYLQGVLTAEDWHWIDEKRSESVANKITKVSKNTKKKYRLSPTVKDLMGSVHIDPKHIEEDERLRYILSK